MVEVVLPDAHDVAGRARDRRLQFHVGQVDRIALVADAGEAGFQVVVAPDQIDDVGNRLAEDHVERSHLASLSIDKAGHPAATHPESRELHPSLLNHY